MQVVRPHHRIGQGFQERQQLLDGFRSPLRRRRIVPGGRRLETVVQHRLRRSDELPPGVWIGADHVVGVATLGQDGDAKVHGGCILVTDESLPGDHRYRFSLRVLSVHFLHHLVPPQRRLAAGGVRVQRQDDAPCLALHQAHLPLRQRCPHRRHHVIEPPLMSGDRVHVPFNYYGAALPADAVQSAIQSI